MQANFPIQISNLANIDKSEIFINNFSNIFFNSVIALHFINPRKILAFSQ